MEKTIKMSWTGWFMALFLILIPLEAYADLRDFLLKFQPSITVEEEYNNNIFLTPKNKVDDFMTTIYPGLRFSTKERSEAIGQPQSNSHHSREKLWSRSGLSCRVCILCQE